MKFDFDNSHEDEKPLEVVVDSYMIHNYLEQTVALGNPEAQLALEKLKVSQDVPIVMITAPFDYYVGFLLDTLERYGILLMDDQLFQEFNKQILFEKLDDLCKEIINREESIESSFYQIQNHYLPVNRVNNTYHSAKYYLMKDTLESIFDNGVSKRTFIAIGGEKPELIFIDDVTYLLNKDNAEFFVKACVNDRLKKLNANLAFRSATESSGYLGLLKKQNSFIHN